MALIFYKSASVDEMQLFVSGGILGSLRKDAYYLVGQTITFSSPAFAHVFTDPGVGYLTFADVKSQLEGASVGFLVTLVDDHVAFSKPGTAVALAALPETAREALGLSKAVTAGVVVPAANFKGAYAMANYHVLVYDA